MDSGKAVLVRRDTGEKIFVEQASLVQDVKNLLDKIQVEFPLVCYHGPRRSREGANFTIISLSS